MARAQQKLKSSGDFVESSWTEPPQGWRMPWKVRFDLCSGRSVVFGVSEVNSHAEALKRGLLLLQPMIVVLDNGPGPGY